jgi:hypothetical protein
VSQPLVSSLHPSGAHLCHVDFSGAALPRTPSRMHTHVTVPDRCTVGRKTTVPSVGQSETSFQASLNDKILVVKLRILYEDHEVIPAFTHCIIVLALLGHAKYATEERAAGPLCVRFPWENWAIETSQLFYFGNHFPRTFLSSYGARRFLECTPVEVRGSNMRVSTRKLRLTLRDFNQEGLFKCLDDSTISAGVEYGWHYNGDYALGFEPAGLASITKFFDILDAHESAKTLPYRSVSRLIDIPQDAHALGCSVGMTGNNILLFCQNVSVRCLCKN